MHGRNLTARAAHWSAEHRKIAIFGWLGAVVVSLFLSGAVGLNTIKPENQGVGESRHADQLQAAAGFFDRANENVLVQARGGETISDPAFRAAIADVAGTLRGERYVRAVKSPLTAGDEGQVSRDRRSALVGFYVV